jgi:hypothetical protein
VSQQQQKTEERVSVSEKLREGKESGHQRVKRGQKKCAQAVEKVKRDKSANQINRAKRANTEGD